MAECSEKQTLDKKRKENIRKNWMFLVENLSSDNELFDMLISKDTYTYRNMNTIRDIKNLFERNEKLLDVLYRSSGEQIKAFQQALVACKQQHVANLLDINECRDEPGHRDDKINQLSKQVNFLTAELEKLTERDILKRAKGHVKSRSERLTREITDINIEFEKASSTDFHFSEMQEKLSKLCHDMADLKDEFEKLKAEVRQKDTPEEESKNVASYESGSINSNNMDSSLTEEKRMRHEEEQQLAHKLCNERRKHRRGKSEGAIRISHKIIRESQTSPSGPKLQRKIKSQYDRPSKDCMVVKGNEKEHPDIKLSKRNTDISFGFGIKGGTEYNTPIVVHKIAEDGCADNGKLQLNDEILEVNGVVAETYKKTLRILNEASATDDVMTLKIRRVNSQTETSAFLLHKLF